MDIFDTAVEKVSTNDHQYANQTNSSAQGLRQVARASVAATLCFVLTLGGFVNNTIVPSLSSGKLELRLEMLTGLPISASSFGMDGLRLVEHARMLREDPDYLEKFPSPPEAAMASPLLFWLVMPLTHVSNRAALLWIVGTTSLGLAVAIWLGGVSGAWTRASTPASLMIGCFAAALMALFCFGSYPYFFAVERGNWHGAEVLCSMGACATLLLKPHLISLQALLLALAVHFKIYPLVLVPMFLVHHGWKFLPWFALWYVPGLFSWGLEHFVAYVVKVREFSTRASGGPWAHDATTWSLWMAQTFNWPSEMVQWLAKGVPLVIWGVALCLAYRMKTMSSFLLLYVSSVTVMSVMQTLSWDYKLVITFPALAGLSAMLFSDYVNHGRVFDLMLLLSVILTAGLLTRNPCFSSAILVKNKFLLLVGIQLVALLKHVSLTTAQQAVRNQYE